MQQCWSKVELEINLYKKKTEYKQTHNAAIFVPEFGPESARLEHNIEHKQQFVKNAQQELILYKSGVGFGFYKERS